MNSLRSLPLALPIALLVLVGASLLLASPWMGQGFDVSDLSTDSQNRLTRQLEDGSLLTLDNGSAVDLEFDRTQRRIHLLKGQLLLEAARGDTRPLYIVTPYATLRPLDATLIVERLQDSSEVTVLDGRVEFQGNDGRLSLNRSHYLRFDAQGHSTPIKVDGGDAQAAWYLERLPGTGQALNEVLERLARHHRGVLLFSAASLADLRVANDLALDDSDEALQSLEAALPITVSHYTDWITVVRRR
ncbi:FecR domain-containing protein [Pseudomonas sp. REB1044]|uniref:FecR family protein n=1 Tax=Pseudomonas sp. REB1044 TaxID=2675224 RepID=UPI00315D35C4